MVNWQCWTFRFLDTCFFRDGLPYHAGEGGYTMVRTIFPPFITTLQGAIRTCLAEERGWRPGQKNGWPAELGGPDDPGDLQFRGPYLWTAEGPLFPMPLHLLVKKMQDVSYAFTRLIPGDPVKCDLGEVRLTVPDPPLAGAGLPENLFLLPSGLQTVLQGGLPETSEVQDSAKLWATEYRTGLERDDNTRTAWKGMLYNCAHVRPDRGLGLVVLVCGIPKEWPVAPRRVLNLGGEGRMAEVKVDLLAAEQALLPPPGIPAPHTDGRLYFTATLITPGWYEDLERVIREGPPGIPGKCVSACLGKVVQVGGWDLANQEPRPLVQLLPAGSTWFFAADVAEVDDLANLHGQCIGAGTAYGFGQILIGKWREEI
nr:type III-B CRISPR module-associated Cmr3 family protein [Desulfofundulus thermobenzoicus]